MGISRVTKKLVPQLGEVDGAILVLNATDPQFATFALFASAVSHVPNFIVLNKCDRISETAAQQIAQKFPGRHIILASTKTGRGMDEVRARLKEMSGRIITLGVFNSGKTSLINRLTGSNAEVGAIPGTTLEFTEHSYNGSIMLVDSVGQIIDISKPLMVSIDMSKCKNTAQRLKHCFIEEINALMATSESARPGLLSAVQLILAAIEKGNKVVTVGAGASALVAMEMAGQGQETGVPIMAFTNNLAQAQPVSFAKGTEENEEALAQYICRAVAPGDVVIGVSASGGTGFVYRVLEISREKLARTIAITENSDTPLGYAADVIIKSEAKPEGPSSSKIQVAHLAIGHALMVVLAEERGITAEESIQFMMPQVLKNKRMGIK